MTNQDLNTIVTASGLPYKEWYRTIYLKSSHWQKLKCEKYKLVGRRCEICGKKRKIQVHHLNYRNIFDVEPGDLQVLCEYHHKEAHGIETTKRSPSKIARYTHALCDPCLSWKAKGVLAFILHKSKNWRFDIQEIRASGLGGAGQIRSAVNELLRAGYASMRQGRADGRFTGNEWRFTSRKPATPLGEHMEDVFPR